MNDTLQNTGVSNNSGQPLGKAAPALSVEKLRKLYGGTVAVDDVSFQVGRNEIVGLLGPNGAGKTTTINMILGVLEPTAGLIRIEDLDLATSRSKALGRTNFAAVYAPLPGNLTVYQNLRIFGMIYGVKNLRERIETLLEPVRTRAFSENKMRRPLFRRADPCFTGQGFTE